VNEGRVTVAGRAEELTRWEMCHKLRQDANTGLDDLYNRKMRDKPDAETV
jgi:hypothetical protein